MVKNTGEWLIVGTKDGSFATPNTIVSMDGLQLKAKNGTITSPVILNRGRNTSGVGSIYVYWFAPTVDTIGLYYSNSTSDSSVAFSNVVDISGIYRKCP